MRMEAWRKLMAVGMIMCVDTPPSGNGGDDDGGDNDAPNITVDANGDDDGNNDGEDTGGSDNDGGDDTGQTGDDKNADLGRKIEQLTNDIAAKDAIIAQLRAAIAEAQENAGVPIDSNINDDNDDGEDDSPDTITTEDLFGKPGESSDDDND